MCTVTMETKTLLLLSETEIFISCINLKRFIKGVILVFHIIDDVVWVTFVSVITDTVRTCFICFCLYTVQWFNELIYINYLFFRMSTPTQPTKQLSDHFRFYGNNTDCYSYVVPLMKTNLKISINNQILQALMLFVRPMTVWYCLSINICIINLTCKALRLCVGLVMV